MKRILCFILILYFYPGRGQDIKQEDLAAYSSSRYYSMMEQLYQSQDFRFIWLRKPGLRKELNEVIKRAPILALEEDHYQDPVLYKVGTDNFLAVHHDSVETDLKLTETALHFFCDIKNGNARPAFRSDGLAYSPNTSVVVHSLREKIATGRLSGMIAELQPSSKEFRGMLALMNQWLNMATGEGFADAVIRSKKMDSTNLPFIARLKQLGSLETSLQSVDKNQLEEALKRAQQRFDLVVDGKLGPASIRALNVPLKRRISELKLAINYLRWIEDIRRQRSVLLLNIPAAYLKVYEKNELLMELKLIVGKPSTPTPSLSSTIRETVLYPYWMVPAKIAIKELLPSIKKNIRFLYANNYQVLTKNGRLVDPYGVNWNSLGPGNFPYIIRQSTGCENALGIVKFDFENPFTVYLHDTPTKKLFNSRRRFFSHGCMRVEHPEQLAHYLLGSNSIAIDTLTEKGCINHKAPKTLKVEKPLPIMIFYSTCWYSEDGEARFYEDVYGRWGKN